MLDASLILSVICLVGLNPVWSGEIRELIILESQNTAKNLQIGVDDRNWSIILGKAVVLTGFRDQGHIIFF